MLGLLAAIYLAFPWSWSRGAGLHAEATGVPAAKAIFTGVLVADSFTVVLRGLLLLFAILFTTFTQMAGVSDQDDMTEFYVLMLGALVGMCLMISANHILIVCWASRWPACRATCWPACSGTDPKSSEAAMKYAVFGAGTAGVMLYGMSLLVGVLGSAHLPTMTARLATCFKIRAASRPAR